MIKYNLINSYGENIFDLFDHSSLSYFFIIVDEDVGDTKEDILITKNLTGCREILFINLC
jgi:hypothetical protein